MSGTFLRSSLRHLIKWAEKLVQMQTSKLTTKLKLHNATQYLCDTDRDSMLLCQNVYNIPHQVILLLIVLIENIETKKSVSGRLEIQITR